MARELREFVELYRLDLISSEEMETAVEGYMELFSERMPRIPRSASFDLDKLSDRESRELFRFCKRNIARLLHLLEIPSHVRVPGKFNLPGETALCIVLRRLSYPCRLRDLEGMFGCSSQTLSFVFNHTVELIACSKGHLLHELRTLQWLTPEKLEYYTQAIVGRGAALTNCWAFIDGTARRICRPTHDQKEYFSGHKRHHCVKYQSILAPDGIIVNLQGPYVGRRHDSGILAACDMESQLRNFGVFPNRRYVVYRDPGYATSDFLVSPFPTAVQEHQEMFNKSMSKVRQAVEWGFGKIVNIFAFVDFHKNQKILLQDVGNMYKAATILTNCHTCCYKGLVCDYFDTEPTTLEEYLG